MRVALAAFAGGLPLRLVPEIPILCQSVPKGGGIHQGPDSICGLKLCSYRARLDLW